MPNNEDSKELMLRLPKFDNSMQELAADLGINPTDLRIGALTGHILVNHLSPDTVEAMRRAGETQVEVVRIEKERAQLIAKAEIDKAEIDKSKVALVQKEETLRKEKDFQIEREKTAQTTEETNRSKEETYRAKEETKRRYALHVLQGVAMVLASGTAALHGIDGTTFLLVIGAVFSPQIVKEIKEAAIGFKSAHNKAS